TAGFDPKPLSWRSRAEASAILPCPRPRLGLATGGPAKWHGRWRGIMIPNEFPALNFDLGETAAQLRASVRAFTSDEIAPLAAAIDRSNEFPRQLWPKLGALGLHGITVEEEYGGAGLGYLEHVVAMEEISRGSAAV